MADEWLEPVPPFEYMDLYMDLYEHSCQDLIHLDVPFEEIVARRDLNATNEAHFFRLQHPSPSVNTSHPTTFNGFSAEEFVPVSQVTASHPNEAPFPSRSAEHERGAVEPTEINLVQDMTTTSANDDLNLIVDRNDNRPISEDDGSSFESADRCRPTWEDRGRSSDFDRPFLPVMCLEIDGHTDSTLASDATDYYNGISDDLSTPDSLLPSDGASTTSPFERMESDDHSTHLRRERRREQNRLAARRCRIRRNQIYDQLVQSQIDLESKNADLKEEILCLQPIFEKLRDALVTHSKHCNVGLLEASVTLRPTEAQR